MEDNVKGFPGYHVTRDGELYKNGKKQKLFYHHRYLRRIIRNGSIIKNIKIHRLVAEAYIPNPENKPYVNHKDGDKTNYQLDNLEWVTAQENSIHASNTGLNDNAYAATSKPVNQLHKQTGELINEFSSIGEAAKCTGITWQNIASVCKGKRKSAGGFVWRYA